MKHVPQLGKLFLVLLLIGLIGVACNRGAPAPAPAPAPTTAPAEVAAPTTAAEPIAAPTTAPEPTQAPEPTVEPTAEPTAAPTAEPPAATLNIIAVMGNAKGPNAITTTVKYITDTVVGEKTAAVALLTSGLTNVPLGVPVKLEAAPQISGTKVSGANWTLTAPEGSKATITGTLQAAFTPDLVGAYKVDAVLVGEGGARGELASVTVHAGTFIGESKGNCKQCHPAVAAEWPKTGHAHILSDLIDNKRTPDVPTHYAETCIRCHTTGYYPGVENGGYADAAAKANYKLPTFKEIDAAGKGGASNWEKMPAEVKNMANIQCEDCHGPANEHVTKGAKVMDASFDNGVCDQCHNGGGHHVKGTQIQASAHSDVTSDAFTRPVGPEEQDCVRCHSGAGYVTFVKNPDKPASWDNSMQTVGCSTCHDPHSDKNVFQLRITGKPVALPFEAKDAGLSATCEECHNARRAGADAVKGRTPHYSSAAELLNDTGGVDYGQKIPNSPHGMMVGTAPVPNPAAADDPEASKFMFTTAGKEGNTPGPCVTCHMWPSPDDPLDPGYQKVGSHSFNTVSADGKAYTASCQQCHTDMKDTFNIAAKADYDGNGKTEGVQDEVTGLLNVLWKALEEKGMKRIETGNPYGQMPENPSDNLRNAWYNFRTVYGVMWGEGSEGNQGKASAIHNFKRAVGLLQTSYKDLTGQDVPGATLMK